MKRLITSETKPAKDETDCHLKTLSRKDLIKRIDRKNQQVKDNTPNVTLLSGESITRNLYNIIQLHGKPHSIPPLTYGKPTFKDNNSAPTINI